MQCEFTRGTFCPIKKKKILGTSNRPGDYAQAIMELGALICKPKKPFCKKCPLTKNCKSYKKQDFEIAVKSKKKIDKFFKVKIFTRGSKILLIKNTKFNFLKNLSITNSIFAPIGSIIVVLGFLAGILQANKSTAVSWRGRKYSVREFSQNYLKV